MSTILEALRKSEQERKLNKIPTLSDMPAPEERSSLPRAWLVALLVVVLVLLIMIIIWLGNRWLGGTDLAPDSAVGVYSAPSESVTPGNPQTVQNGNEIVISVVSWSESAEQRFAIVNGKLVREGEFVRPGLKVEKIKSDSVLLNQRGLRIERRP